MKNYRVTFKFWTFDNPWAKTATATIRADHERFAIPDAEKMVRDRIGEDLKDIVFWEIEEEPDHLMRWGESMYGGYYAEINTGEKVPAYIRTEKLKDLRKRLKDDHKIEHLPICRRWDN